MPKKPVSLTIEDTNLVWLQGAAARRGARSLSETVDQIITAARTGGDATAAAARSVVGSIDIGDTDPELEGADAAVSDLFARSLARPFLVKERGLAIGSKRARRG